ncbi:MAG TPA: energy transducer TonB [Burkholderiales bacterium]|nr:energy transducer TonB [Burkholderiales bacterium]
MSLRDLHFVRLPRAARLVLAALVASLAGCSVAPPKKVSPAPPAALAPPSSARSLAAYEREVALRVQAASAREVYAGRPQFFLRAVIVYRLEIDAAGRPVRVELYRAPQRAGTHELVARAIASVRRAAPFPRPNPRLLGGYDTVALMETWLFDDDGRFRLRAVSLPQK